MPAILLSLFALIFAAPSSASVPSLENAQQLLAQGKPREAEVVLHDLVRREPRNSEAHYWRAKALIKQGENWKALESARQAVAVADTAAKYHVLLGGIWWERKGYDITGTAASLSECRREYEAALALDSTSVAARRGLLQLALRAPGLSGGPRREARVVLQGIPAGAFETVRGPGFAMGMPLATIADVGPDVAIVVVLLVTGLLVGLLRARDPIAFYFAIALLAVACVRLPVASLTALWPAGLVVWRETAFSLAFPIALYSGFHLLSVFPSRSCWGHFLLRWLWVILLPYALTALTELLWCVSLLNPALAPLAAFLSSHVPEYSPWHLIVGIALFASILIAQRIEARGQPARRLKVVETAFAIILAAGLIDTMEELITPPTHRAAAAALYILWYWITPVANLVAVVLLARSILTQRLFGLRFVIRRGLQSLLLSRGVLAVEAFALFVLLLFVVERWVASLTASVPAVAGLSAAATLAITVGLRRVNRPLMTMIDRRFFTEAYDARRVLLGLGERVSSLTDRGPMLERAGDAVMAALHPARLAFLMRAPGGRWFPEWSRIAARRPAPDVERAPGPAELEDLGGPLTALASGEQWLEIPRSREEVDAGLDPNRAAPIELLVALRSGDELLGCLALAAKLSEEPYSGEDRELLQGVANQLGLALKNAALLDVAKREAVQARDLEIARRVQQGLFPQELPRAGGWDLAAVCRPAREVGGDYYDVFEFAPGRIALSLGDVSGKGLGASLLTASLHAIVRSRLPQRADDLGGLMGEMNEHLSASTPPEIFVTLFLAVLDTGTGVLRYVNGGHPAPVVVRGGSAGPELLSTGGTLVGALPGMRYVEGVATLARDSVVVVYSDGVSEATDAEGRMFEEEGIVAALGGVRAQGAGVVLAHVLAEVDAFVAGAEQSDDISLIVLVRCGADASGAEPRPAKEAARAD
jgi:serine phosphatase RsbU (regulator of sigma subunit)